MEIRRVIVVICLGVLLLIALTACGTPNPMKGVPLEKSGQVYGFWSGLWDGLTANCAFVGNLFGGHWGIYQVHNNGNWYDFGFLLGIGALGGVISRIGLLFRRSH